MDELTGWMDQIDGITGWIVDGWNNWMNSEWLWVDRMDDISSKSINYSAYSCTDHLQASTSIQLKLKGIPETFQQGLR